MLCTPTNLLLTSAYKDTDNHLESSIVFGKLMVSEIQKSIPIYNWL